MTKIVGYTTVSHPAFTLGSQTGGPRFPLEVQKLIDKGWQPFGAPFIVQDSQKTREPYIGQAMVLYSKDGA